jgi:hypothetical protein
LPRAEVEHRGSFPNTPLRGRGQIVKEEPGRVAGLEHLERRPGAVQDDGHLIVDIVRRGGCHGSGAVGSRKSFHASILAGSFLPPVPRGT